MRSYLLAAIAGLGLAATGAAQEGYRFPSLGERAEYLADRTVGLRPALTSSLIAGIRHLSDSPEEWGQGASGYGKRLASRHGRLAICESLQFGLGAAFREDNRYLRSSRSGFLPRLGDAVASTVLARKPEGGRTASFSTLAAHSGSAIAAAYWHPSPNSRAAEAARTAGFSLGLAAGMNVAREFSPELKRLFRRR